MECNHSISDILTGKVVVITGAASGIGRASAIGAARHGAKAVIVSDVTEAPRRPVRSQRSVCPHDSALPM
jgi:NAD(P)-dependent dehydrogenase (short-subunit alcohol dehydrogenase family)